MKIKKINLLWILLILVFLIRVLYYIAQPDFCTDHISQMATAKSFMNGNGVSLPYVSEDDISKINYKTHIQWPPAYPILLSLITFITKNLLLSSFFIAIISILITIYYWHKILELYNEIISQNTKILFLTFIIITPSILNNINTILIPSLGITSASLYYFIKLINSKIKILNLILISFLISLNFWFHYSYILLPFFISLVLFTEYIRKKDKIILKYTIISLLIIIASESLILIYNYLYSGSINYMENPYKWEKGIFLKNLQYTDPIFLSAISKIVYFTSFISNVSLFHILLHLMSLGIFISIIISYYKIKKSENKEINNLFLNLFIVSLMILILLLYFSLRYYEIPRPGWTHIGDPRYLSIVYLVIILLLFIAGFNITLYNLFLSKIIRIMLIFFLSVNIILNIYNIKLNIGRTYFNPDKLVKEEPLYDLYYIIKRNVESGNKVIYIDNGATVRQIRMAAFAGAVICDSNYFMNNVLKTKEEVICVFSVLTKDMREIDLKLNKFGRDNDYQKIGEIYDEPLYKIILKPKNE